MSAEPTSGAAVLRSGIVDSPVELTVLLPCLNEAESVAQCIRRAQSSIVRLGVPGEVLVADNGSIDGSRDIARREGARVLRVRRRGYGVTVRAGIAAARGAFIVMADADDSYDLDGIAPFLDRLRAGDDLVMGNRFAGGIEAGAMPPLNRYLGNPVLTGIARLLYRSPIGDFHCGAARVPAIRRAVAAAAQRGHGVGQRDGHTRHAGGLRISELPTTLRMGGRSRPSHLRPWRDGARHLRLLVLHAPRERYLPGGLALSVGGVVGLGVLLASPQTRVPGRDGAADLRRPGGREVAALPVAGTALVVGYQSLVLAGLAEALAVHEALLPGPLRAVGSGPSASRPRRPRPTGAAGRVPWAAGALLLVGGAVGAVRSRNGRGTRAGTLRRTVPSLIAILLGAETLTAAGLAGRAVGRWPAPAQASEPVGVRRWAEARERRLGSGPARRAAAGG